MSLRDLQRSLHAAKASESRLLGNSHEAAETIVDLCDIPIKSRYWGYGEEDVKAMIPVVDRLVAKYGPKLLISDLEEQMSSDEAPQTNGEERKKDTDEVKPASSQTTKNAHGGDGRSGEVPDGNSQSGEASRDSRKVAAQAQSDHEQSDKESKEDQGDQRGQRGQGTNSPQGSADPRAGNASGAEHEGPKVGAAETGSTATSQTEMGTQKVQGPLLAQDSAAQTQQECSGESGSENLYNIGQAAKDAQPGASADNDAASTDRTISESDRESDKAAQSDDEPAMAKKVGEDQGEDTSEKTPSNKKTSRALAKMTNGKASRQARNMHGGITAELRKAKIMPAIVSKARAVLSAWTADGGSDEQSQRWDYPKLASRLLTKRSPYPARKEELGRPVLLVLADVSGSCAGFSNQSLLVARAIASTGMPGCDVLVVSHSNGYPDACEINGKPLPAQQYQHYKDIADRKGASQLSYGMLGNVAFYEAMIADYTITHVIALGDHDAVDVYAMLAEQSSVQQVAWLDNYACNMHDPRIEKPRVQRVAAKAKMRYVTGCKDANAFLVGLRIAIGG